MTVEAASDALIEKTRSVVTDANGGYRLVDLRPGTYSLTFSLEGFSTVKRDAIQLESNFVMTVNSEMKVGALEETLTVTGASPTVDVQSTTKSQVLNRETLDAIPTGRTIQGMGQLITGISLNQPDIGGSKAMQQTYMSGHGAGASQTTVQVDGLMVNGVDVDGAVQSYFNSSMSQEMVYTTSGASADVAGGGVRLNMIPRDGGNTMNGSIFYGYQNQSFQSNNVGDDLKKRGLTTSDGIGKLSNLEGSLGGPIKKDKIWYFGSARYFLLDTLPANTFNGIPGTGTATSAPLPSYRQGHGPAEHQVRPGARHLAAEPEEQAGDLQRPPAQEPRLGHDCRLRSRHRRHRLELADLHDRFGEVQLDGQQQDLHRDRLLHELRAVQHDLPGWPSEGARLTRSGTRSSTRTTAARAPSGAPARPTRACTRIASPPWSPRRT